MIGLPERIAGPLLQRLEAEGHPTLRGDSWPLPAPSGELGLVIAYTPAAAGMTLNIRRSTAARLMMISSASPSERARSLDLGADVCMGDIEDAMLVEAQLMALLRLDRIAARPLERVAIGAVELEMDSRRVSVHGVPMTLSRREFDLLAYLMRQPNRAIRRHDLLGAVWGSRFVGESNTVDVHIAWLRQKLPADSGIRLTTLRGIGYRLDLL